MNIEVIRTGTKVQVKWTHGYPVSNFVSTLELDRGNEFDARLCEEEMQSSFQKEIRRIRE